MLSSAAKSKLLNPNVSTAEAFYRLFCALPKKDRLVVVKYILDDEEIRQSFDLTEIPNKVTVKAFAEDKARMPAFESIQGLREDLLS